MPSGSANCAAAPTSSCASPRPDTRASSHCRGHPLNHTPRKRFGQHFLVDAGVIGRIVDDIRPAPGERVVEIGPGLGAITRPLAERLRARPGAERASAPRLTVIELDRDLAERWRRDGSVRVIEADVLTVDWRALATELGGPLRVVGNLPYNISSPILFALLPAADVVVDQHVMLQREVVERMAAQPGSKAYGRLSVMLQWRYDIANLLDVPPTAFKPPPQVDSAVAWMRPRSLATLGLREGDVLPLAGVLESLVAAAFSQRRKLLRHSLGRWLDDRCEKAGTEVPAFDLQRRAEEVAVADYVALARALG